MELSDKSKFIKKQFATFNLTANELQILDDLIDVVSVKKGHCFLDFGNRSSHFGLIMQGSFYSAAIDEHGNEIIHDIFYETEKPFIIDYESYLQDKPTAHTIKANSEAVLIKVNIQRTLQLYIDHPRFYQLELLVLQQNFLSAISRIKILQEQEPANKIKFLQDNLPDIFHHFSYSQIASYLGVHRNTINRALKKI